MAKITLSTLTSAFNAITKLNSNFTSIKNELNNKVLYRDNPAGEANQMENDLDLNSNDIQNVGTITATSMVLGGDVVTTRELAAASPGTISGTILMTDSVPYTALSGEVLFFDTTGSNSDTFPYTVTNSDFVSGSAPLVTQGTKIFEKPIPYIADGSFHVTGQVPVMLDDTGLCVIAAFIQSGDGTQTQCIGTFVYRTYDSGGSVKPWTMVPISAGYTLLPGTTTPNTNNKFILRCSVNSGNTAYINQNNAGNNFGGKLFTLMSAFVYRVT